MTTKRTMGQCHGIDNGCVMAIPSCEWSHTADCPALYPLQRQPGDEKDALTRLVMLLRNHSEGDDEFTAAAIDLISEAREDLKRTEAAARAYAESAAGHAKTMDVLLDTQKHMGEVRQASIREGQEDLLALTKAELLDRWQHFHDQKENA